MLEELDSQARQFGAYVPAYINIERKRIREELGMADTVLNAAVGPNISEELGDRGRFVWYAEQFRQLQNLVHEAFVRGEERMERT